MHQKIPPTSHAFFDRFTGKRVNRPAYYGQGIEQKYLLWLADARGWHREGAPCHWCLGRGYTATRRGGWRDRCTLCQGKGDLPPGPDLDRARDHVEAQRAWLEQRAWAGVDIARWRLLVLGAEPVSEGATRQWWDRIPWEQESPWRGTYERPDLLRLNGKLIHLGIAPRRGYDRKVRPHDAELLIRPGMAPTEAEVCAMVAELVAGLELEPAAEPSLPLAA
jgi:hypothetical protein